MDYRSQITYLRFKLSYHCHLAMSYQGKLLDYLLLHISLFAQ